MYALFINMSVRNWHFGTAGGVAMRFLIEPVYCMTWIWTLHRAHKKLKSPIEEDNIWARLEPTGWILCMEKTYINILDRNLMHFWRLDSHFTVGSSCKTLNLVL